MAWLPPLEMYEKEDKVVVRAEIPGMKQEEIDIAVEDSTLTIKGERKAESEVKDEDYYRCELSYGRFSRSVALPSKVQAEKVAASYDDGILEITLPKAPEAKPKKIAVKAKKAKVK
jgi:HSP20 family protein